MQSKSTGYKHINQEERVEIYVFLREWLSKREIGRRLNRSHTTISREIKRNSLDKGREVYVYKPLEAEKKYKERKFNENQMHIY